MDFLPDPGREVWHAQHRRHGFVLEYEEETQSDTSYSRFSPTMIGAGKLNADGSFHYLDDNKVEENWNIGKVIGDELSLVFTHAPPPPPTTLDRTRAYISAQEGDIWNL